MHCTPPAPPAPFYSCYVPQHTPTRCDNAHLLARIRPGCGSIQAGEHGGDIATSLTPLESPARDELLLTHAPLQQGNRGDVHYRHNADVALMAICIAGNIPPAAAAEHAYRQLLELSHELGQPALIRTWNYFPDINAADPDTQLERYRAFSLGRHRAFSADARFEKRLPAACALGCDGDDLIVFALTTRHLVTQVENPRQISAYHYPKQYGPRSPSFARAVTVEWPRHPAQLFISGTASIVGHESRHIGNLQAQVDETLCNLEAVIEQARRQCPPLAIHALTQLDTLRAYIRHPEDVPVVRQQLAVRGIDSGKVDLVRADVCRTELLIEIEAAFYGLVPSEKRASSSRLA